MTAGLTTTGADYIMMQQRCVLVSPTTSLVLPENLGTVAGWVGFAVVSCFTSTSGSELMLWLLVE